MQLVRRGSSAGSGTITPGRTCGRWGLCAASSLAALVILAGSWPITQLQAQGTTPTLTDPRLAVRTVVTGLTNPTTMAFIGPHDILVLEKTTGRVQRVMNGTIQTVLDLAVNFGSERGLLGIALHPDFPRDPGVYLYWTESSTGADTDVLSDTALLGNRVDRYVWNGSSLTHDLNLIRLRAIQADATNPVARGNHDGGVLAFAQEPGDRRHKDGDGEKADDQEKADTAQERKDRGRQRSPAKLFVFVGDLGRRGQMQNLPDGPFGPGVDDDQFGGPEPDDAHLSGVVLRLNDDGSTPEDNPFFEYGATVGGEVGANLQKVYAFGFRNGFGIAVDPRSGHLWSQENGDDSFSELNRVEPGMNGGWVQIMGPVSRIAQFKATETAPAPFFGLQQVRWSPELLADTPAEALLRLFVLPESKYSDPEFSWRFEVAPAGLGFVHKSTLGREFEGDLLLGAARPDLAGGYIFRFDLTEDRRAIAVRDRRLLDKVADNTAKFDGTESESLMLGMNFGVGTDIEMGPNGHVFVVSLTHGAIYEIGRRR